MPIALALVGAATAVYGIEEGKKGTAAALKVEQSQTDAAAAQEKNQRMEEARALRATARASAAESAISGNSVDAISNDIMAQAGKDVSLIETNRRNGTAASAAEAAARNRISSAQGYGSAVNSLANGASSAYDAYTIKKG